MSFRPHLRIAGAIHCTASRLCLALACTAVMLPALAHGEGLVLYEDVRIFDGRDDTLSLASNVLVRGNVIDTISVDPIEADGAEIIDGAGRTLMPGLIDAHWHTMLVGTTPDDGLNDDLGYSTIIAVNEAEAALMRGFTTVRDMGGAAFSLKRAIDEGRVVGPRIYPSGAIITVTSGHGDFRSLTELPREIGHLSRMEELGMAMVADSPDEVRMRAREQLMLGAVQIKLTAGGGVASPHSPLDVSTFTLEELHAAVEAAENWGTYVAVHAYTPAAIQRSVEAGVKVIEHGHLMDAETAKMMAEKGIWLSTQPFDASFEKGIALPEANLQRLREVITGTDRLYGFVKEFGIKTAFGTDILFSSQMAQTQGFMLTLLQRWFTPAEILKMATATNGELLQLTGPRNPYPGTIGVIEKGAFADLLLVDGNPLENLDLVADPNNFVVIMKDGNIYKNTLALANSEPGASIGLGNQFPVSNYLCEDGTRLAVRLLGESALVSVNDAAEIDLPSIGAEGTTFSNGPLTLTIEQGRLSWGIGRAMPSACSGA
ncbi:metal-dependent hydrolase family protein [Devosia limi]|uniref:Imidazolonepropionase n=1 Tax=Devosia limi DSM 17137 TaxID=1121477 RepID=A0A1M5D3Y3_9HYPH|nr:Imidazolonepropionase [Devosia limi DSM 17137]